MSSCAGVGTLLSFSNLPLSKHRGNMSYNCLRLKSNGKPPANFKLQRGKDVFNCVGNLRRKLTILWILAFFTAILAIWLLLILSSEPWRKQEISLQHCTEKAMIFLRNNNVSENQIHHLASLFAESDQVKCTQDARTDIPSHDRLVCGLRQLCSSKQEWYLKSKDQCPVSYHSIYQRSVQSVLEEHFESHSSISLESDNTKGKQQCDRWSYCLVLGVIIGGLQIYIFGLKFSKSRKEKPSQVKIVAANRSGGGGGGGTWRKKLLVVFVVSGIIFSVWLFWFLNKKIVMRRKEILTNMCDERARMLQDQFNVSMNHVNAFAILVSTFHHGKNPSAIDQKTFGEYTERTNFERPLTSGVAYALKVVHAERERFEKQHGWTIKKMVSEDQTLVQDCIPENLDPAPIQDEYAPVIFSQETVAHIVSIDMMSGREDRENILRARATGKGVLTSPFKLLKSNHLGVVLTFAVYNEYLPPNATPEQRIEATVGYLGASYDVPSLVEKLLHQLASKQTIVVHVYDTTNASSPITMYGTDVGDPDLVRINHVDFGDPLRKHEMHCRFKQKPPLPWTAINASVGSLVIILLVGHIFHGAIIRIAKVEEDCQKMMELKALAEAADIAKSQFLATVSHEIRTPMNGVLGMLQMLMDTSLNAHQMDFAQTAHASGKDLISLINGVLDQAKIESGRLELECVPFDLRSVLDKILSLYSRKSDEKGIEFAIYVSDQVPDVVIGDPGRFRQIIVNLVGNSLKFNAKGHIFVSVHLADEVRGPIDSIRDEVLQQSLNLAHSRPTITYKNNTLSGLPVVDRWKSWKTFKTFNGTETYSGPEKFELLVAVEDTGVGISLDVQDRIFTPFMQADSSTSRTYGGTGIGLSISKRLVELMQGEIGFMSEPGIGSTFSFTGIFSKAEMSSVDTIEHLDRSSCYFRGLRALVVDNRVIRAAVTRYHLRRLGISVIVSSSMKSACSNLSSTSGKSLLVELAMIFVDKDVWNKEDSFELRALLKAHEESSVGEISINIPKIFLLAPPLNPVELKSAGLIDNVVVLTKPLRVSALITCFQEAFGSSKKRQVNQKKRSNLGILLREKQILVVDDNMVNRRVAEGALKKYGAIVTCVDSGKIALAKLHPPHSFDACFMDIQMPEMDGFEATRQIRNVEKDVNEKIASGKTRVDMFQNVAHWHVPILAMTADLIQATKEECSKCGMDDYVSKPFEEEQLYATVAQFFETVR